jgi:hypothetical protein
VNEITDVNEPESLRDHQTGVISQRKGAKP